ncbi:MAG: 30S ribosomal protein S8 [Anaerolineae bacterium]|mgnify:FL=1|nr:30S ribosomal protein S8 [Ardenticatenia bacterium]MBK8539477.1 30S ribosomal protein S8 [Ardenticatenia bacterium]HQZ71342.1 30S ribosomal protein S8 [Anaerolineae bacterium]HRA19629.1 30S ribosomal protein S8 [Anaerolineae bacterium]
MSMSDPIADMLTRIRNAAERRHATVAIPASTIKQSIADILQREGYIDGFDVVESGPHHNLRIKLKYAADKRSVISHLERVSKPGRRVYTKYAEVPWILSGMGVAILTTPKGVMTGTDARRAKVGGEILCYVW